ncbi:hypothetical protein GCM10023318_40210 [Nocardia callitridis]|uniref:Transcription factor zinc-finger domain-containing protein n=2 Tax=Nocardia callitridis TaxID=648753 RepID=A0ABP9KIF8_9NOCA
MLDFGSIFGSPSNCPGCGSAAVDLVDAEPEVRLGCRGCGAQWDAGLGDLGVPNGVDVPRDRDAANTGSPGVRAGEARPNGGAAHASGQRNNAGPVGGRHGNYRRDGDDFTLSGEFGT